MEFNLKAGTQGHFYFPKKIRDTFGNKLTLLPNDVAGAIYPENADPIRVIASLEVIIQHLKLQAQKEIEEIRKR